MLTSPPGQPEGLAEELAGIATRITILTRPAVRTVGLTLPQARVLARLVDDGPQRIADLTLAEQVAQPTMSALVAGLVRRGLVVRLHDFGDARAVLLQATAQGRALRARVRTARAGAVGARLAVLAPEERRLLEAALPALRRLAGNDHRTRAAR
jgi:DNA-binding MarR family transcriptional regulator